MPKSPEVQGAAAPCSDCPASLCAGKFAKSPYHAELTTAARPLTIWAACVFALPVLGWCLLAPFLATAKPGWQLLSIVLVLLASALLARCLAPRLEHALQQRLPQLPHILADGRTN